MRLNAKELREADVLSADYVAKKVRRKPLYFILEDIYDTYNVGGLFRLADALAVSKIYICGQMETPPNPRIKKASIGTYKVVPWSYEENVAEAIRELRTGPVSAQPQTRSLSLGSLGRPVLRHPSSAVQVIAVEQAKNSVPYSEVEYKAPVALVFGNETSGIKASTLKLCDAVAEIPMWGVNKSLNVIVSAGIVGYWAVRKL